VNDLKVGGVILKEGTDVKFTIEDVSDNGTVAEGSIEFFLIDNT
jgi:hypothetical protein